MKVWQKLWAEIVSIFTPISGRWLSEGLRLMAANCSYLLAADILWLVIYKLVSLLQALYIPIPQPVGLLLLALGIPYCVIWFIFGQKFGSHLDSHPFLYGILLSIIGLIPNIIYIMRTYMEISEYSFATELERISLVVLGILSLVLPIITALGSLDGYNKKSNA